MNKPLEYICIKSGHAAIIQRKDKPQIATEAETEEKAMDLMRIVDPALSGNKYQEQNNAETK